MTHDQIAQMYLAATTFIAALFGSVLVSLLFWRRRIRSPTVPGNPVVLFAITPELAQLVDRELLKALDAFPPHHSLHESYAVLLEEVNELWDEVRCRHPNPARIQAEALQVAAMAIRLIQDIKKRGGT